MTKNTLFKPIRRIFFLTSNFISLKLSCKPSKEVKFVFINFVGFLFNYILHHSYTGGWVLKSYPRYQCYMFGTLYDSR